MNANTWNNAGAYWGGYRAGESEDLTTAEHAAEAAYWASVGLGEAFARGVADALAAEAAAVAAYEAEVA